MRARHTLLTHFSARYPKVPVLKSGGGGGGSTFVAYDLMTVRGRDVASLPALLPALHAIFRDPPAAAAAAGGGGADDEREGLSTADAFLPTAFD